MAAKQFGFVMARSLAVLSLMFGFQHLYYFLVALAAGSEYFQPVRWAGIFVVGSFILFAALLWTMADRFSSDLGDTEPSVRSGNWVVRLWFTSLGIVIMILSLNEVVRPIIELAMAWGVRSLETYTKIDMGINIAEFLIGLAIFVAYRFDKRAAFSAAQAIEESEA